MSGSRGRFIIGWLFILLGLADLSSEPAYRLVFGKAGYPAEAAFTIPGSTLELILDRRCIHSFLAEYERTLVLRDEDGDVLRFAVAVDTGGLSRMRVYQVSASKFFLQGDLSFDRYLLDISKPSVAREISMERPATAQFIGAFDRDEEGWRFISVQREEL